MNDASKDADPQREEITRLLADGLATHTEPVPQDQNEFEKIAAEIRQLGHGDLEAKAVVAGLTNHPRVEEGEELRCQECMYYLANRRWCDLPDLNLPVEHDWWCRLWRI